MPGILYVGFGTAEAWLQDRVSDCAVNVDVITQEDARGQYGLGHSVSHLVLSYCEMGSGELSYLMIKIDGWQTINGQPFAQNEAEAVKQHKRRSESALAAAEAWLKSKGIRYRISVVAMPKDHKLLEGVASWLRYEKDADAFYFYLQEG